MPRSGARFVAFMLGLFAVRATFAQTHPATTAPVNSMSREALEEMDRAELGSRFDAAQAGTYYEIHKLIEKYFTTRSAEDRKAFTSAIVAYGVDPNIVGRLVRIRMDWPEPTAGSHFIRARVGPVEVTYCLGIPKAYQRSIAMPLVIMLPTQTATGEAVAPEVVANRYASLIDAELAKHPDAIVLMPISDPREGYGPSYAGMNDVIRSMQHATTTVNIDPARVSLIGMETSAAAVWNLGLHCTTYFSAIEPFAGQANAEWQRVRLMNLRNTHIVAWHDVEDPVLKVDNSRQPTDILKRMKFEVDYEETRGMGHVPNEAVIERGYRKAMSHPRELYPREVSIQSNRPDTEFNRIDWVQMYQPARPGPDRRLLFRHGGSMTVNTNPMSIKAKVADNVIDADPDNVESMRFYVNDQMIDFSRPVTLMVNKRVKFQGKLMPSMDEMLKDQLFLGRGWRYYTAVIDLDMGEPATKPATRMTSKSSTRGR